MWYVKELHFIEQQLQKSTLQLNLQGLWQYSKVQTVPAFESHFGHKQTNKVNLMDFRQKLNYFLFTEYND